MFLGYAGRLISSRTKLRRYAYFHTLAYPKAAERVI
jgi:hypothetical protein